MHAACVHSLHGFKPANMSASKCKINDFFGPATAKASRATTKTSEVEAAASSSQEKVPPSKQPGPRKIKPAWFARFKWLQHEKEKKVFFCKYCISSGRANIFTKGKTAALPKADDFAKHEATADHKLAVSAQAAVDAKEMPKAAGKAYDSIKEAVTATMRNVYYIIREDLPKEKLASLNQQCILQVRIT